MPAMANDDMMASNTPEIPEGSETEQPIDQVVDQEQDAANSAAPLEMDIYFGDDTVVQPLTTTYDESTFLNIFWVEDPLYTIPQG
jgi:hypothetical protein